MGNRAVLVWKDKDGHYDDSSMGVYLHWNGGRDSIEAFLAYCEMKDLKSPSENVSIGIRNFVDVVAGFFGSNQSIYIDKMSDLDQDNWDNGVYVCDGWKIVDRKYFDGEEQDEHDFKEMLHAINSRQAEPFDSDDLDRKIDDWLEANA